MFTRLLCIFVCLPFLISPHVALAASDNDYSDKSGIVIGILYSADPQVLVRVEGEKQVIIALQDVELSDTDSSDLAASISKLCALICHKRISWDVLSEKGESEYRAYAYLGDLWLNEEVVRLGLASATGNPVHPALH